MMHNQPNNPEYCQGIFDAAQKVVEHAESDINEIKNYEFLIEMWELLANLKRALEGKP